MEGVVTPIGNVVTAKTGVKKWLTGQEVFLSLVKQSSTIFISQARTQLGTGELGAVAPPIFIRRGLSPPFPRPCIIASINRLYLPVTITASQLHRTVATGADDPDHFHTTV